MSIAESTFEVSGIGQISVPVEDLDRATAFYRDKLGLRFLFRAPPGMAFFDCGGVRLMLGVAESDADAGASILYFTVDDIEAAHAALAERGVDFVQPPQKVAEMEDHELWLAFFEDADRNTMALMSEVPR